MGKILDSGERTEFDSGAVRDMHEGKGIGKKVSRVIVLLIVL